MGEVAALGRRCGYSVGVRFGSEGDGLGRELPFTHGRGGGRRQCRGMLAALLEMEMECVARREAFAAA